MILKSIDLVRFYVSNIQQSKAWYEKVFALSPLVDTDFYVEFRLSNFGFALVPTDAKNPISTGGSTTYWKVENFSDAVAHFQKNGATVYRGLLEVPEEGTTICQIIDPFGNVIGLVS